MNKALNVTFCLLAWLAIGSGIAPQQVQGQPNSNPLASGASETSKSCPRGKGQPVGESYQTDNYIPIDLGQLPPDKSLIGSDPKAIALAVFGQKEAVEGNFQETVTVTQPQPNLAIVVVTQLGLPDDSLRGLRYRLELQQEKTAGQSQWRLVWAGRQHTCQPGRGPQTWTVKPCS